MIEVVRGDIGTSSKMCTFPAAVSVLFVAIVFVTLKTYSTRTRTYSLILPIFKISRRRLALKPHWNVHGVLSGVCCMLTMRASCHGHRAG